MNKLTNGWPNESPPVIYMTEMDMYGSSLPRSASQCLVEHRGEFPGVLSGGISGLK